MVNNYTYNQPSPVYNVPGMNYMPYNEVGYQVFFKIMFTKILIRE